MKTLTEYIKLTSIKINSKTNIEYKNLKWRDTSIPAGRKD